MGAQTSQTRSFPQSQAEVPVGFGQERNAVRLPVLTMVSSYSRWLSAVLVPSRHAADLFAGWRKLTAALGGVPRVLVWDGEGAIGRWRAGKAELTAECQAFRGTLGTRVVNCRPTGRPEATGPVERASPSLRQGLWRAMHSRQPRLVMPTPVVVVQPGVAADVTTAAYTEMITGGMFEPGQSAFALHHAVRAVRDSGRPLDDWLPFTHWPMSAHFV